VLGNDDGRNHQHHRRQQHRKIHEPLARDADAQTDVQDQGDDQEARGKGGSSSIKFALYQAGDSTGGRLYGKMDRLGLTRVTLIFNELAADPLFCYQARKWIGAFAAVPGAVDTVVLACGFGENAPLIRARLGDGLDLLGIAFEERNDRNAPLISMDAAPVKVRLIRIDEVLVIAKSLARVLNLGPCPESALG